MCGLQGRVPRCARCASAMSRTYCFLGVQFAMENFTPWQTKYQFGTITILTVQSGWGSDLRYPLL